MKRKEKTKNTQIPDNKMDETSALKQKQEQTNIEEAFILSHRIAWSIVKVVSLLLTTRMNTASNMMFVLHFITMTNIESIPNDIRNTKNILITIIGK